MLQAKSITSDDLEQLYRTPLHKWCVFQNSPRKCKSKADLYYQRHRNKAQRIYFQAIL